MKTFWKTGKSYFLRTVTMYIVGTLKEITDDELLFTNASWVSDTGLFHDALKNGKLRSVEPFVSDVLVNRKALIDATEWKHALPIKPFTEK